MRTIARFMDARNTAEGKFLSVLLSVLLVFSFLNVTMFTDYANAEDETAPEVTVEETQSLDAVDPVTDESEEEAEEGEGTPEQEQPESEEPAGEVNEPDAEIMSEAPKNEETNTEQGVTQKIASASDRSLYEASALSLDAEQVLANDSYTVEIGEKTTVSGSGSGNGYNHSWSATPSGKVSLSWDKSRCSVTGEKAGDVTLTHTYYTYQWFTQIKHTETFTIKVNEAKTRINPPLQIVG